ncbi:hypothetical protein GCM10022200_05480 [Microbacterium awajiense]|uniref:XRE family transcriptional regulator n=1 Tax=Microbacterium awajiense TaxID=415214 RepID=A0ABP7A6N1_9MICO
MTTVTISDEAARSCEYIVSRISDWPDDLAADRLGTTVETVRDLRRDPSLLEVRHALIIARCLGTTASALWEESVR